MPDFVATYRLTEDPPERWYAEISALADSSGLGVASVKKGGSRQLSITVRAPKNTHGLTNELVSSFFSDVVNILSSGKGGAQRAQLVDLRPTGKFSARTNIILSVLGFNAALVAIASIIYSAYSYIYKGAPPELNTLGTIGMIGVAGFTFIVPRALEEELPRASGSGLPADVEKNVQIVNERVLAQEVSTTEDPKTQARVELARIRLRGRASSMRGDADRLWRRSLWAYRGAFAFYCIAIAIGPAVAARLLLMKEQPDWHFMFGGLSLAAVPLAIGTALLRHDTKLRDQYQEAARDVALLERYELALDYSQLTSSGNYQKTIQQVVSQLLLSRPAMTTHSSPSSTSDANEDAESLSAARKIVDRAVDKAVDVIDSITPRKTS
jgi:hypothetical protein